MVVLYQKKSIISIIESTSIYNVPQFELRLLHFIKWIQILDMFGSIYLLSNEFIYSK